MEVVKWQYRNPYHSTRHDTERLFVFGAHTVAMKQHPSADIGLHQNTGFLVWDGAYIMARFIFERLDLRHKTCLELGAGSGLVSIAACLHGAKSVVATDLPEYQPGQAVDQGVVQHPVDVVFGSEILYLADQHHALLRTLGQIMHNTSVAYFIYKDRGLGEHGFVSRAQEQGFLVKELPKALIDSEFKDEAYHLLRLNKHI
ncbi:Methyltransferase-like protein 21B [Coemansia sp. Benny D115]|nr:Methyltransferase-like protein 21B [Coemansia sp. Benny D115]